MELTLSVGRLSGLFKQALQFTEIGRGIDPGLRLVHIEVTDRGRVRLSAHDATSGAKIVTVVEGPVPGQVAVGAEQLDRLVTILPSDGHVRLQTVSDTKLVVTVGKRLRMDIPIQSADNFLPLPIPSADGWFEVTERDLDNVIRRCLWATCGDESKPALSGVHLTSARSETTDGKMMSRVTPGIVPKGVDVIVPADSWQRLRTFVEAGSKRVCMCVESNRVWIRSSTWAVYSQLIASTFPNIEDVVFEVDGDNIHYIGNTPIRVHSISVNRGELLDVVKRIGSASVSQEERKIGASVAFDLRDDKYLHLVSNYPIENMENSILVDERVDWSEDSVTIDDTSGFERLRDIGVYSHFTRLALQALSSDVIKIMSADAPVIGNMPMQFHDEKSGAVSLVMPRRL